MSETTSTVDPMMQNLQAVLDVRLENFEGPLDLLLFLIRKSDLNVYDIPIGQITTEYLSYLDLMKELNLEMAGEFLVMASTLMQIKAQLLLPSQATTEEEGPDPRAELVNKLLEYQQFKEASSILSTYNERAKDVFYRQSAPRFGEDDYMLKASTLDLLNAFKRILQDAPKEVGQILREEITIEARIREVLDLLTDRPRIPFGELFVGRHRRIDLIVTFMAVLELMRLKQIVAMQSQIFGEIEIVRADAVLAEQASVVEESPIESIAPALPADMLPELALTRPVTPVLENSIVVAEDSPIAPVIEPVTEIVSTLVVNPTPENTEELPETSPSLEEDGNGNERH